MIDISFICFYIVLSKLNCRTNGRRVFEIINQFFKIN